MRQLIDALEGLLTATSIAGGETVDDVNFAIAGVDWSAKLKAEKPCSYPIVDDQLEKSCDDSIHEYGSNAHLVCEAVLEVRDQLRWCVGYEEYENEPDMAALSRNFAYCTLIGKGEPLHSDKIYAGISLQGRDTYYPPHAHQADERYWVVGGNGDWKVGLEPWFAVEHGAMIHHDTGVRHAMQTNADPLLCVWLWTSYLDSSVVIVRG